MLLPTVVALAATIFPAYVQAAVVEYNWEVTYVNAAPDGFARRVIGVNGAWPCPTIEASVGDTIRVHMTNRLTEETTGIHFHGINQVGTPWQDGPSGVTQCPVPPGHTITYEFLADAPGTYWYHSHNMGQYPDGFRGPLIVHDPKDPFSGKYDEEFVVTLSDWYHQSSIDLVKGMLVPTNTRFAPPLGLAGPDGMLVNDGGSVDYKVEVGKTYRFRFMNIGAFTSFFLHFDGHPMTVIMQDASYTVAKEADQLRISPAQRFDVLITITEQDGVKNFPFLMAMDFSPNWRLTKPAPWSELNKFNTTGYLVLDPYGPKPPAETIYQLQPFNDNLLQPYDGTPAWGPVSKHITLDFTPAFDANGIPRMPFNGKPYVQQKVPTLYTASSVGEANTNPDVYGQVNPFIVSLGDIVEIVINNNHSAIHPFHLHGHQFQVLDRPLPQAGFYRGNSTAPAAPSRKDTVHVEPFSYVVLRVKITHPGVFLLHCHIEWHVEMGLVATLIQAPQQLRNLPIPQDHLQACIDSGVPHKGNAAGNQDPLNTTGFRTVADTDYTGALWFPQQNAANNSDNGSKVVFTASSSRLAPRFFPQSFMALFSGAFVAFIWML